MVRYSAEGLSGLLDRPKPGRPPTLTEGEQRVSRRGVAALAWGERKREHLSQVVGHEALRRELTTRKGITLAEIRDALIERGIEPGAPTTIWETLRRLGLTHKEGPARRRTGSTRRG